MTESRRDKGYPMRPIAASRLRAQGYENAHRYDEESSPTPAIDVRTSASEDGLRVRAQSKPSNLK